MLPCSKLSVKENNSCLKNNHYPCIWQIFNLSTLWKISALLSFEWFLIFVFMFKSSRIKNMNRSCLFMKVSNNNSYKFFFFFSLSIQYNCEFIYPIVNKGSASPLWLCIHLLLKLLIHLYTLMRCVLTTVSK